MAKSGWKITVQSLLFSAIIVLGALCAIPAHALDLWTRGTPIESDDGQIVFWQTWSDAQEKFRIHDITYRSDGHNVKAWILAPKGDDPHPVLLYCRGGGGSGFIRWWATFVAEDGRVPHLYQRDLFPHAEAGMVVVATNFRDTGQTVAAGGDDFYPTNPAVPADLTIGGADPFAPSGQNQDPHGRR